MPKNSTNLETLPVQLPYFFFPDTPFPQLRSLSYPTYLRFIVWPLADCWGSANRKRTPAPASIDITIYNILTNYKHAHTHLDSFLF